MPKKILFIESDATFASRVSDSLEASGFEVRVTGDGKEGLDLAREWSPSAIVLCVELPGMSGYLVCQKLKKDDALKAIPLVLTSAEATEETFEKHRTLKARADEYLLKPYEPPALVAQLGALVGMPEAPAAEESEEELVTLEEEVGLEAAPGEPEAEVPGLDLESLPDEPPAAGAGHVDEDLRLLDDAFDSLSTPAAEPERPSEAAAAAAALDELTGERPVAGDEVDAAAATLPDDDEGAARAELAALEDDADAALGALAGIDETLSPGLSLVRPPPLEPALELEPEPDLEPERPAVRGASADLLRRAGIKLLDDDVPALTPAPSPFAAPAIITPPPPDLGGVSGAAGDAEAELRDARDTIDQLRDELTARDREVRDLESRVAELDRRADDAEAETARLRGRIDDTEARLREAESDAAARREEARRSADEVRRTAEQVRVAETALAEARRKAAELEKRAAAAEEETRRAGEELRRKAEAAAAAAEALARAEALEREADGLRTELVVARGEVEGARGEVEKRTGELRRRLADVEAANAKNEERVVKAYQKIKADEKVRDKVRKALAIASQLLEEGLPSDAPADKDRRAPQPPTREP